MSLHNLWRSGGSREFKIHISSSQFIFGSCNYLELHGVESARESKINFEANLQALIN